MKLSPDDLAALILDLQTLAADWDRKLRDFQIRKYGRARQVGTVFSRELIQVLKRHGVAITP